ncbi:MAG: trypsin-like peptidase domain-containing protein [Gammaproteobacteria bacterium]|nr:trypsin-like peptidase domain-containing protein [Gammaproteobacteria bacterium]MDH5653545.1 trypsin-like peptidase domain-containing protein [Gammaproteobacteria bacterium]
MNRSTPPSRFTTLLGSLLLPVFLSVAHAAPEESDTTETGVYSALSLGTAWAVTRKHVVTNYHVIANTTNLRLVTPNQMEIPVKVIAVDEENDLAILALQGRARLGSTLPLSNKSSGLGTPVFTIGYPHPDLMGTSPKLTAGHINALTGIADDPRIYQVDVPVQSGNSGGPLLNMHGEVVAIIASKLNAKKLFDRTGDVPQNVNYAIKIDQLDALLKKSRISDQVKMAGYETKQSLEKLADKSLGAVLIIAGDNPEAKRKAIQQASISPPMPVLPKPAQQPTPPAVSATPVTPPQAVRKPRIEVLAYIEPDHYFKDDNKPGARTITDFSHSVGQVMQSHLAKLYAGQVEFRTLTGATVKKIHYAYDDKSTLEEKCRDAGSNLVLSAYSEDNSGRGQYFRYVSYMIVDCTAARIFRKQYTIRRDDLNDTFDYELAMHDSFKGFLLATPPYIALQQLSPPMIGLALKPGRISIYSYAQPGDFDVNTHISGSFTVPIYSENTAGVLRTHVNMLFGNSTDTLVRSGENFKGVYHELENEQSLRRYCINDKAEYIISSYSENESGKSVHARHVTYVIAGCQNKRVYKKRYYIERDEMSDSFGYEMALHGTFKDFLLKLPPFITAQN